ncbi:MAG TPA: AI-2E family transporter [Vicinamibacterales bacterium]
MAGFVTLIIALVAALYVCWLMLQPFLNVLLWAAVLTVVFYPMHRRIHARLHGASSAAAASTLLVVILILLPVTFITFAVIREFTAAAAQMESGGDVLSIRSPWIRWILAHAERFVHIDEAAAREFLTSRLQAWGAVLASSTLVVVGGVVGAVVQMGLVVFTMFYLFRDGERLRHTIYDMLPLERVQTSEITERTRDVISATLYGVLVISLIQGTLGTFIFWVLGLPSPLLWGVVMFFLSMIPMAGSFLVWAPAAVYLALTGAYVKALVLLAWGVLVIGSIDNFLSPRLVGKRACLHELLIFFAVLGGLQVFGVLGLVLGPVVVAITLALIEMVRQAHRPPAETLAEPTVLEEQSSLRETS